MPRGDRHYRRSGVGRRDDGDPLQTAADAFGLSPVSGDLPTVTGPPTSKVWLRPVVGDGMELVHEHGADQIDPYPEWREVVIAERQALLIIGRGMHLDRREPETISRGLSTQPCWGAIVPSSPPPLMTSYPAFIRECEPCASPVSTGLIRATPTRIT